ncbi:LSU ribosomal protein L20 [Candidatus Phytoplasma mali]|uniref:Large ribosomal subunit protein bL20 n=2 Tax=cellular organisms TaxID=131567 RepID=B3R0P6_PHYMT|nr:50S ribosomal protein L20 [Candidatus Phytoplasma mali]CAP18630.1 LSU ribosomal protein L20 [Candidatus Phytoplasma mali]
MSKISFVPARHRRRKKILKLAKGYVGSKSTIYKTAHEQVMRSLQYAYRDRKQRKREFKKLWISRINASVFAYGIKYSSFVHGLKLANVFINRKVLSELAIHNPDVFVQYVELAKKFLSEKISTTITKPKKVLINEILNEKKINVNQLKNEKKNTKDLNDIDKRTSELKNNNDKTLLLEKENDIEHIDLSKMLVKDLKDLAKKHNINNFNKLKKTDLIKVLKSFYKQ